MGWGEACGRIVDGILSELLHNSRVAFYGTLSIVPTLSCGADLARETS
jgi:hypothetical protein